jgi:hypothetical protein
MSALFSASRELEEQSALADSGLPDNLNRNRLPATELVKRLIELAELCCTTDELPSMTSKR